ncbi:MAG: hypothetical protein ACXWYS_00045 [Gaiellaceae bacterium]
MFRDLFRRIFRRREPGEIDMRPTRDRLLTHPADNQSRHGTSEAFDAGIRAGGGTIGGN